MTDLINILIALSSIGLGAVGWLAPRYTMDLLDMAPTRSTMGLSEIRAASGALFIGLGLGALVLGTPLAFAMVLFLVRPDDRTWARMERVTRWSGLGWKEGGRTRGVGAGSRRTRGKSSAEKVAFFLTLPTGIDARRAGVLVFLFLEEVAAGAFLDPAMESWGVMITGGADTRRAWRRYLLWRLHLTSSRASGKSLWKYCRQQER